MGVSWARAQGIDRVIAEQPARPRRITPEVVAGDLARSFDRPVVEWQGLVVNHEITDIERYARVMGWDDES